MSATGRQSGAFSLLELVIVVAIVGIAAGIAVPRYQSAAQRYRAQAAAQRIAGDLALLAATARTTTTARTVVFDAATASYLFPALHDIDNPAERYKVLLGGEPYGATIVSASFGGDAELVFDGWGSPDSEGEVRLRVGDEGRVVSVDAVSGAVTVTRYTP